MGALDPSEVGGGRGTVIQKHQRVAICLAVTTGAKNERESIRARKRLASPLRRAD